MPDESEVRKTIVVPPVVLVMNVVADRDWSVSEFPDVAMLKDVGAIDADFDVAIAAR